jgi:hypothetical protein
MLLHGLSITVRYLPDLWYEIQSGEMDHIGSLNEYYLSIIGHVVPLEMLQRIAGERIQVSMPGSLSGSV